MAVTSMSYLHDSRENKSAPKARLIGNLSVEYSRMGACILGHALTEKNLAELIMWLQKAQEYSRKAEK